jgi:hypothetical protein
MFTPVPYYVVGTISILLGIGELITFLFYRKESRKRKYPNIDRIISFTPTEITIKI